jgi:hypothetical protein
VAYSACCYFEGDNPKYYGVFKRGEAPLLKNPPPLLLRRGGQGVRLRILVKLIHGGSQTLGEEAEEGFGNFGYNWGNSLFLLGGEVAEDIVNNLFLAGFSRPPDAYSDTDKILTAQLGDD